MNIDSEKLNRLLVEEYDKLASSEIADTGVLAQKTYARLDPDQLAPTLVHHAAIMHLKQMARGICRRAFLDEQVTSEQNNLFDFKLQSRYPANHSNPEEIDRYLPVAQMSAEDFDFNINRLDSESKAKQLHADALRAEKEARQRGGLLAPSRVA